MFSIITALISLAGIGISAAVSSSAANKQVGATMEANAQNMGLNRMQLGIEKENAETNRYSVQQNVRLADFKNFNDTLSKYSKLKTDVLGIWSGR
jgi:hypothetical protein